VNSIYQHSRKGTSGICIQNFGVPKEDHAIAPKRHHQSSRTISHARKPVSLIKQAHEIQECQHFTFFSDDNPPEKIEIINDSGIFHCGTH
jgi:hypothetical protein